MLTKSIKRALQLKTQREKRFHHPNLDDLQGWKSLEAEKAIPKDSSFNPPKDKRTRFERVAQTREVIYEGVYILGASVLLKWEKAKNMIKNFVFASSATVYGEPNIFPTNEDCIFKADLINKSSLA